MDSKDAVRYVKDELSSDEKLLESAFRLERFYKRNKIKIWAILIVLTVGFGGKVVSDAYKEHKIVKANDALVILLKNPNDKMALSELKANNPKLYALYNYSYAIKTGDLNRLNSIDASKDALLKDLISYHKAVLQNRAGDSKYYNDLSQVEKAYLALKEGKKADAKALLALIPENSPVAGVAQLLKHYTIK